jgi:hypothetical protein
LRWGAISQIEISYRTEQREKKGRDIRAYWGRAETMKCRGLASRGKVVEAVAEAVIR